MVETVGACCVIIVYHLFYVKASKMWEPLGVASNYLITCCHMMLGKHTVYLSELMASYIVKMLYSY